MSNLLINEPPLQVLPSLATSINCALNDRLPDGKYSSGGLNEAIVLQQIHYWIENVKTTGRVIDGEKWIYNSIASWGDNFPFWGENTIRRTLQNLEMIGLVKSRKDLNKIKIDQTKWYTINYNALSSLPFTNNHKPFTQNGQMDCPNWVNGLPILGKPIPETTSENTSETTKEEGGEPLPPPPTEIKKPATPKKEKTPKPPKPASVIIYRKITHRYPPGAMDTVIEAAVGNEPGALEFWRQVVLGYIGQGWNPANINGMIEFYKRGEVPSKPKAFNGNGNSNGTNGNSGTTLSGEQREAYKILMSQIKQEAK